MINLKNSPISNPDEFVECMVTLARAFPGQPVAIVADDDGGLRTGILNLLDPTDEDWFMAPVTPEKIVQEQETSS